MSGREDETRVNEEAMRTASQADVEAYLEKHKVSKLMQHLFSKLIYNQPEKVERFLVEELKQLKLLRRGEDGCQQLLRCEEDGCQQLPRRGEDGCQQLPSLFTREDVAAVFERYDVARKGHITAHQLADVCSTLGLKTPSDPAKTYSKDAFLATVSVNHTHT